MDTNGHKSYHQPMNVRLTRQQQEFVKQQVALGRYLSEAEVIREGLRLLADELEWRAQARGKVAIGLEQVRSGQTVEGEQAIGSVLKTLRVMRRKAPGG